MEVIKRETGTYYREKIYFDGRTISKTFKRKSDAKLWKSQMETKKTNLELDLKHFERIKFEDFAHTWLEEKVLTYSAESTYKNYKRYLKNQLLPFFGQLALQDIKRGHVDRLVLFMKKNGNNAKGINLVLGCLRNILNAAVDQDYLRSSPLKGFKNLKEEVRSEIYMTEMEIRQLLKANMDDDLYPLYVTALNTGMRRGELAGLKWDRVNFARKQIEVGRIRDVHGLRPTTKGGRRRIVPMNEQVLALFKKLHKKRDERRKFGPQSDFVFVTSRGEPFRVQHTYRSFFRAQKRAGLDRRFRFHDLRHTFASHFMMNGGNLYDLQKIMGHSKIEMTMRYAHLAPEHLIDAVNVVSFGSLHGESEEAKSGPSSGEDDDKIVHL